MKKNNKAKRYKVSKKILEMFKEAGITEENRTYDRQHFSYEESKNYLLNPNKLNVRFSSYVHESGLIFRYVSYDEPNSTKRNFELISWSSFFPYLNFDLAKKFVTDYITIKASCSLVKPENENELEYIPLNEEIIKEEVRKRKVDYENER